MTNALIYKEWLKTKWFILAIILANLAVLIYIFINISQSLRLVGAHHIWSVIVNKNVFLFSMLKYLPISSAVILSVAQYIPEVSKKRLKLTLHLPIKQTKSIFTMLAFGIAVLLACFFIQAAVLGLFAYKYFSYEIVASVFITILPWYMSGITVYILVVFICLEPTWKHRIIYLLFTFAMVHVFLLSDFPSAYSKAWYLILILLIVSIVFPIHSLNRFKQGVQD